MKRQPKPVKRRRYHQADDNAATFDVSNPDWLVGAD